MIILSWARLILGIICLLIGIYLFCVEIIGIFKFKYVLNRMHAAAMGDTLGIGACLLGLMLLSGWNFTTLKLGLVIMFLWCSSPVSSHLISKLQAVTDENLEENCDVSDKICKELRSLEVNGESEEM